MWQPGLVVVRSFSCPVYVSTVAKPSETANPLGTFWPFCTISATARRESLLTGSPEALKITYALPVSLSRKATERALSSGGIHGRPASAMARSLFEDHLFRGWLFGRGLWRARLHTSGCPQRRLR